jgi:hypothetical protein
MSRRTFFLEIVPGQQFRASLTSEAGEGQARDAECIPTAAG